MLDRFRNVIRMMVGASAGRDRRRSSESRQEFAQSSASCSPSTGSELTVAPERVAHYVRLVAFSGAIPAFTQDMGFTADELTDSHPAAASSTDPHRPSPLEEAG